MARGILVTAWKLPLFGLLFATLTFFRALEGISGSFCAVKALGGLGIGAGGPGAGSTGVDWVGLGWRDSWQEWPWGAQGGGEQAGPLHPITPRQHDDTSS